MFGKLNLLSLLLLPAEGARVKQRKQGHVSKHTIIEGVPVHNYHLAFDQSRWEEASMSDMAALAEGQERWVLLLRQDISAADLQAACAGHTTLTCHAHGHSGVVPFIELHGSEEELKKVLVEQKGNVVLVEPDLPMAAIPELDVAQADAEEVPWGLRRIRARSLDAMPRGDPGAADGGKGVNVYILDTGIRTTHDDFDDRAIPAMQLGWFNSVKVCNGDRGCALDKQGHGTHCAGTVGGRTYGVAKGALLHAVKVLSDSGTGSAAGVMKGMDWVAFNRQMPAVASMSLGGRYSASENQAVDQMVAQGVIVVTASGNSNDNSCNFSPGSAPSAINVGSTDSTDERSSFSNYGECLDLWAPGRAVLSAGVGADDATLVASGTSMACPHVAGAVAMLLRPTHGLPSPSFPPAEIKARLVKEASQGMVTGVPTYPLSPNLLLFSE